MSEASTPLSYMEKAQRALGAARLLRIAEDSEGVCNRAYYAMFDAARAALLAVGGDLPDAAAKTHRGLIAAFGRQLVMGHHVAAEFGSALNKVERLRQIADYSGDPVSLADATWALEQAETFVEAMRATFFTD